MFGPIRWRTIVETVTSYFTYFEVRRLEWCLAIYTTIFGLIVMLPPISMASPGFRGVLSLMTEFQWGACYAIAGVVHCVSLHINGRAGWTPFARCAALFINSQVFLALALMIARVNPWSTGVITYTALFFFCVVAFRASALDCGREIVLLRERWRCNRNTRGR